MTHVICRLTAKNRDQLRKPRLGNRVWATFTVFITLNPNHNQRTNVRDGIIIRGAGVRVGANVWSSRLAIWTWSCVWRTFRASLITEWRDGDGRRAQSSIYHHWAPYGTFITETQTRGHTRTQNFTVGNESVPTIIINNTINLFLLTAISILVISNHDRLRVLFDKKNSYIYSKNFIFIGLL